MKRIQRIQGVLITLALVFASPLSLADTLVIPSFNNQPSDPGQGVPRPSRGMSMAQVREQFGEPLQVWGPVGNPPITRWVYNRFVVHFEGEYVIHTVIKKS